MVAGGSVRQALVELRDRIYALLPGGVVAVTEAWGRFEDSVTLFFDPTCAGNIERCWPEIHSLCTACGCSAILVSRDRMEVVSVLDTPSAAPDVTTKSETEVKLVLAHTATLQEVA